MYCFSVITVPEELLKSVLNYEISKDNLEEIFQKVDRLLNGEALDLIVGGPPCQAYSLVGQEYFVKNILNRFSAYYARQGQPDFDFKSEATAIIDKIVPAEAT